jgi:hypothetical protein
VTDYPGELTSLDVSRLINEIQTREPIGAYAVEYIAIVDFNRVLSQYIITLSIVYTHEIRPYITQVSGRRELENAVHSALLDFSSLLTVEMRTFYARDHDAEGMIREFYYSNPGWAMEYPGVNVSMYPPGDALSRIIELELSWQTPPRELMLKSNGAVANAELLLSDLPELTGDEEEIAAQLIYWLYTTLLDTVENVTAEEDRLAGDLNNAYGALVNRAAASEGYSMAFKLLCDMLGYECIVVTGQLRGAGHAWNMVRLGGHWYHISIHDVFLLNDESEAMEPFHWDRSLYPPAPPGHWTHDAILALAGDEQGADET